MPFLSNQCNPPTEQLEWISKLYPEVEIRPVTASAILLKTIQCAWDKPDKNSQKVACYVPAGRVTITCMTADKEWYRLDTGSWVQRSDLQ
jgi:hypothetical protein